MRIIKNIGITILVLFVVVIFMPENIFAASIDVCGTEIYNGDGINYTVENDNITKVGDTEANYNIRLDKDNNKIYLKNFESKKTIRINGIENIEIITEGENIINTNDFNGIESSANIILSGNGNLDVVAEGNAIKTPKEVTINSGTIQVNGTNYNGIEAAIIKMNGGIVIATGGYSGIHARWDPMEYDESYFVITGGNLYTSGNNGDPINGQIKQKDNCIVVKEKEGKVSLEVYGEATLQKDTTVNTNITIPQNATLIIPEDVTLKIEDGAELNILGKIILKGNLFVGDKEYHNIYIKEQEGGKVTVLYNISKAGDEVNITIAIQESYELKSIKYINETTKETVEIKENKFIMPDSNVTIIANFEEIIVEEPEQKPEDEKQDILEEKPAIDNPPTGDNIINYLILTIFSLIALTIAYKKGEKITK